MKRCGPIRSARPRSCSSQGPRRADSPRRCSGASSRVEALFPYPDLTEEERPAVEQAVSEVKAFADTHIDAAAIDREADIPASVIKGLAELGVLGMAAPVEFGRSRLLADGLLPDHGSDRRPLRGDRRVRERPPLDRAPGPGPVRDAGAESALAPPAGPRREARGLRADRRAGRLRREQRPDHRPPLGGRPDLHLERHEAVHHERRHRRRAHRDGPHARSARGRIEGHGVPGHARHARLRGRRGADAQVRHPGHRHGQARLSRHARSGVEHPRPAGQGPEGRADGARFRPDDLRRQLHGAGQGLPRRRHAPRRAAAGSSAGRSPTSS